MPFVPEARRVITVGGPIGSPIGPTGMKGLPGVSITGATGGVGFTGVQGYTGLTGPQGSITDIIGPTGAFGPTGDDGMAGPAGVTGSDRIVIDERMAYLEYRQGIKNIGPYGVYVGCKFFYTVKHPGIVMAMFSGLALPTLGKTISIGANKGTGAAPNGGDSGVVSTSGGGGYTNIMAPSSMSNIAIPFLLQWVDVIYDDQFSPFVEQQYWYDLTVLAGSSSFDPPSGAVKNINFLILEF
jgi:hypothetical protein